MPILDQNTVLSAPAVYWNGRQIKIIPNSFEYSHGGEAKVRAVSAGQNVSLVVGVNLEEMVTSGKFKVANTAEMGAFVDDIVALRNNGTPSTLRMVERTEQKAWIEVYCVNKPTRTYEAEGEIEVEWVGNMQYT
jgi:hypothetical protein